MISSKLLILACSCAAVLPFLIHAGPAEASHSFLRFPWTYGKQGYITQGYNGITHQGDDYYALDVDVEFAFVNGDIRAAATGTVVGRVANSFCDPQQGYGNYVDISTTPPLGANRYARYAHLNSVSVSEGQAVYQGQKIGVEGSTGYSINCAPHLHFRWTSTQDCSSQGCAVEPEPMSGEPGATGYTDFAEGQTWTSDNSDRSPVIEGMLVQAFWPSTSVYIVDNGQKRFIPSAGVFEACGYNWNDIVRVSSATLNMMSTGPNVSTSVCPYILIQAPGSPNVYVIEKGLKRLIASADVFNACGYDWGDIVVANPPPGTGGTLVRPPCPYARRPWHSDSILEGTLVKGSGPAVYIVDLSGKRLINSAGAFVACGYRWNDVVTISDSALTMLITGSTVFGPPCPQSLVQPPGSGFVYVVNNGFKVLIASAPLFESCGYNWDQIVIVNPPSGSGQLTSPPCPYNRD